MWLLEFSEMLGNMCMWNIIIPRMMHAYFYVGVFPCFMLSEREISLIEKWVFYYYKRLESIKKTIVWFKIQTEARIHQLLT